MNKKYYVAGMTHVDLSWTQDEEEMAEMLDVFLVRILDELDRNPAFKYMLEQAYHYRSLAGRRPDLLDRVKQYIKEGRLEFMGGMASTLETNVPCAESFVRNQLLGLRWVKDNLDTDIRTGWLMDTFGIHAQVPQILNQFGITRLMANRFGGDKYEDVFYARGLDGSRLLVAGRDVYSSYLRPGSISDKFARNWNEIDDAFAHASNKKGEGPFLVMVITENAMMVSMRPAHHVAIGNEKTTEPEWGFAVPSEFLDTLMKSDKAWPEEHADLNPEFTATFSQRMPIKIENRKAEFLLLEAEKWATIYGLTDWNQQVEDAWWTMAYIHFHDVFTGSHPTEIYQIVMNKIKSVQDVSNQLLERAMNPNQFEVQSKSKRFHVKAFNGLPWTRTDVFSIALPPGTPGVSRILCDNQEVPFEWNGNQISIKAEIPSLGYQTFEVEPSEKEGTVPSYEIVKNARIENEYILLECDDTVGISRLVWKETGKVLLQNVKDFLVIQQDEGSFQIEQPMNAEVVFAAGEISVGKCSGTDVSNKICLMGEFPSLAWAGQDNKLKWKIAFSLVPGKAALYLNVCIDWKGEASRIRLKLPTLINTGEGIFEVPFGTVKRRAYGTRATARGEWPAQRFVTVEDGHHGLALVNTGVPGVEVNGGTLLTTIVRAPSTEYAGMVVDGSSSQHGNHSFDFAIVPYAGSWLDAGVVRIAQELNSPVLSKACKDPESGNDSKFSFMSLEPSNVVLSAVKETTDGSCEKIVRFYETGGKACVASLFMHGVVHAWNSDLQELKHDKAEIVDGCLYVPMKPFEIKTLRLQLTDGGSW